VFKGSIENAAARAEELLATVAIGAVCVAQEWDHRIDCLLRLPDGSVVGEMLPLNELTERRIRATGERLRKRAAGINVPLVNEVKGPVKLRTERP
jgi:hypothetical protein